MKIQKEIQKLLPPRKRDSHKGDYGRIFILAGSRGLSGACVLAAVAALRSGAGLVTVGVPESLVIPLTRQLTEAMTKPFPETDQGTLDARAFSAILKFAKTQNVIAIGPGLSQHPSTQTLVQKLITGVGKPMVIDADGLNALIGRTSLLKKLKSPAVLTPHPGEFVRLFGKPVPHGRKERCARAAQAAKEFRVVLVLKGNETVVAFPEGGIYVNRTGNSGMATGGAGDVLTGIIAGLLGQGLKPFQAASAGVYLHGLAGDLAAKKMGEVSLIAGDILNHLPSAFRNVLGR